MWQVYDTCTYGLFVERNANCAVVFVCMGSTLTLRISSQFEDVPAYITALLDLSRAFFSLLCLCLFLRLFLLPFVAALSASHHSQYVFSPLFFPFHAIDGEREKRFQLSTWQQEKKVCKKDDMERKEK